MELDGTFLGCMCLCPCMYGGRGWRVHLFPGSCSQPMSCRHGIGRDVFGVCVLVFLDVCGVGDGGLTCFQVAVRSPSVAAMELDGKFSESVCSCSCMYAGSGMAGSPVSR